MNVIERVSLYERQELERHAETSDRLTEYYDGDEERTQDFFSMLLKTKPSLVDRDELDSRHAQTRRDIIAAGLATKEWVSLRSYTRGDPFLSAHATPRVLEEVDDDLADDDYIEANKDLLDYENFLKDLQATDPDDPIEIPESWDQYEKGLRKITHGKQRQAMRRAMRVAEAECEELVEVMGAWGLEDGPDAGLDPTGLRELTERVMKSEKLKKIAQLAGRMERLASVTHESRSTTHAEVICDIAPGDDLQHLLPTEVALLADPKLHPLFLHRYAEKQLLCYELEGKEPLGRGPIVMLYDGSYSMNGPPEIWAKALVFGLLIIAQKEKRDVVVYEFSSTNQQMRWDFLGGKKDPIKLVEMAEHFFGGGTSPELPLRDAVGAIGKSIDDRADMIFLSDGIFSLQRDVLDSIGALKKDRGMRLTTIGIGCGRVAALSSIADDEHTLPNVMSDQEVVDACFAI